MPDYLPKFTGPFTVTATATVTGGRLARAGGTMGADTSLDVVGIFAHDAVTGQKVTVYDLNVGVHRLVASGAIPAGAKVVSDANGKVKALAAVTTPTPADVTGTRAVIGTTLTAAAADGDIVLVKR